MKRSIGIIVTLPLIIAVSLCSYSHARTPPAREGWKLIWNDEFDKDGLPDESKWSYEQGFVRNNEKQYYTKARSQNARIENGVLIIEARKEDYKNAGYKVADALLDTLGGLLFATIFITPLVILAIKGIPSFVVIILSWVLFIIFGLLAGPSSEGNDALQGAGVGGWIPGVIAVLIATIIKRKRDEKKYSEIEDEEVFNDSV